MARRALVVLVVVLALTACGDTDDGDLEADLQSFQTDLGVEPTGVIDPATIAAAQRALEETRTPATPTTTEAAE